MSYSPDVKKSIKSQYTSQLVSQFYNPILSEANLYQRVSGYFSSAGLDLYTEGLEELAKNGGEVQFIISKEISKDDFERIQAGYGLREEIRSLKLAERNEKLSRKSQEQLGNLAFMIANNRARVKIAFVKEGIFHDKFGLIYSGEDVVFFNGSANETKYGISQNYESISVDVSWDESVKVKDRIEENKARFDRLWNDTEEGVTVVEASELTYEEVAPYQAAATLKRIELIEEDIQVKHASNTIDFILNNNRIKRIDNSFDRITSSDRKLKIGGDLTPYFESDNVTIRFGVTYTDIERIINTTKKRAERANILVTVSNAVEEFIVRNKYSIEQYKIVGNVYKSDLRMFPDIKKESYEVFSKTVTEEISRPLKELHMRAAFYEYEMMRTANFSVPGAGKTAMILGVFAFLNRKSCPNHDKIRRILVISPISAFDSWKQEFKIVFGNKKHLVSIDSQDNDFKNKLESDFGISNLILINYEALPSFTSKLKRVIDDKTMLVFDEVHRIKNPYGQRAKAALEIAHIPRYRYVLTGTPIPNKYTDIYNFLNILYGNEYNSFFGWDIEELEKPTVRKIEEINKSIRPFFWRTNKNDLNVPKADEDIVIILEPSDSQSLLAKLIYNTEKSSLAILIRLIQASTNPSLLNSAINYDELMVFDDEESQKERTTGISEKDFYDLLGNTEKSQSENKYNNIDLDSISSRKFEEGIKLVARLVSEGKKVLVWGIFVKTIHKIKRSLEDQDISVNLVYGSTPKNERVALINDFRDGEVQVLISNPQTLGESISLHQSVHDAVYFEYDFNLTHMLQSRDRIHRLGLPENQYTRYYYLETAEMNSAGIRNGFIDEKIYARLKEKENMMYEAIDNNSLSIEYSENDLFEAIRIIDEERRRF